MSRKPDGGPVHPTTPDHQRRMSGVGGSGMTLRDYFAGQWLAGLGADPSTGSQFHNASDVAENCYHMADAMIAARDAK